MSYHNDNPVINPSAHGLARVATIDQAGGWEFDTLVVLQHETGDFFYAADSGCSCPMPFDGFGVPDDHNASRHIEPLISFSHLNRLMDEWVSEYHLSTGEITHARILDFKAKVRRAGLR